MQNLIPRPFIDTAIDGNIKRIFKADVDSDELIWHFDKKNRLVNIVSAGGWLYQEDNCLPIELKDGMIIQINKGVWHRIIKGFDNLVITIIES